MLRNELLGVLLNLISQYPWNNLLQLKAFNVFEACLDDSSLTAAQKLALIKHNMIPSTLVTMARSPTY